MPNLKTEFSSALPALSKAVFSQPGDAAGYTKVSIRPVRLKDRLGFQAEGIRDNKAYHQNLDERALLRFFDEELDGRYRQVLITTRDSAAQYVLKRDGSYKRSSRALAAAPAGGESHNRAKTYLLPEGENIPALVDLGVFTPDFHIVKAKYDKYKQINRFIQLIDDEFAAVDRKNLTILDYLCYVIAIVLFIFLFKTVAGYRTLSVGINKEAAESLGSKGTRIQMAVVVLSGALCGLGGTALSMGQVTMFTENMTSGRGFIAMAASSLGMSHPLLVIFSSLFFGLCQGIGLALQNVIKSQLTMALPYIATVVALVLFSRRTATGKLRKS